MTNPFHSGAGIVVWGGHVLWGVSILLGVVAALAAIAGRNRPTVRHGLWLGALICVLGLPALTGLLDGFGWRIALMRIALPAGLLAAHSAALGPRSVLSPREMAPGAGDGRVAAAGKMDPKQGGSLSAARGEGCAGRANPALAGAVAPGSGRAGGRILLPLAASIWALGSLFLALRLVVGWRRLRRLAREAQAPPSGWRLAELQRVRQALSLNHLPPIALCRRARVPMVVGLVHPRVVLPEALAVDMSPSELTETLIHECAHVRRRDQWVLAVQRLALVAFWPHPLLHYLNRELERAREELCDNHVLAASRPVAYAETLLRLAQACLPAPEWGAGMAMFRRGTGLERRIRRLVDKRRDRDLVLARWPRFGVALLMTLLAAGVSAVQVQVVLHEFNTARYNVPEKVIDEEVQREIRSHGDRMRLIQTLEAEGTTLARYRERVRERIIERAMRDKNVSSESSSRRADSPRQAEVQSGAQPANEGPASAIEGHVLDEDGHPLAGARLWPDRVEPSPLKFGTPRAPAFEPVLSGADGAFRMTGLAPGLYAIRILCDTNAIPGWVAESGWLSVRTGETSRDVQISATRGGFLKVLVLAEGGRAPVAQAHINVLSQAYLVYLAEADADDSGRALLRLPPGEYRVSASKNGAWCADMFVAVELNETNGVELQLNARPKTTGIVRDPAGVPAPGLPVAVLPGDYRVPGSGKTTTDANGGYEVSWNPLQFGRVFNSSCILVQDTARNLAVVRKIDENTTALELRLEPGLVVAGRVQDANGLPLANATVQVMPKTGRMSGDFESSATDSQGRFSLTALPADLNYFMTATAKGYGGLTHDLPKSTLQTNRVELEPFVLRLADRYVSGQVVDAQDKPIAGAWVFFSGEGQQSKDPACADGEGRFMFDEVCAGQVVLTSNTLDARGGVRAQGGDTNIVLKLIALRGPRPAAPDSRATLIGHPLPELASLGLTADNAPVGTPILLCLFDLGQRPSRRCLRLLAEQGDQSRQKGLTVLAVQTAGPTSESFKQWKDSNPMPFPVGRVTEEPGQAKWAMNVKSLPWLILTDAKHHVVAEGFLLEELGEKLKR